MLVYVRIMKTNVHFHDSRDKSENKKTFIDLTEILIRLNTFSQCIPAGY